ncbi:MAG: hypothetical protein VKJ46_12755 [Leptolyngbyaceae bacterium]|nr:hypothetical protein [Leptolyngbyaceae bacterium]
MANLSGTWLGTYWQMGEPTRFEATLIQGGNTLTGSILDDGPLGDAQVSGEVIGRNIRFTKRYLSSSAAPINYSGTLSEDEDFMQGQWQIGRFDSGPWEARRSGDDLMSDLKSRLAKQVPVGAGKT